MPNELVACHMGPTSYEEGLVLQDRMAAWRADGLVGDCVLFPDHPPVLTVGRSPSPGSLRADAQTLARLGIRVFEVPRGGDITWHGPGQLVGYVICDLTRRGRDLHRFLRELEEALIGAVAAFGIEAVRSPGRTGIWVGERKLGSIGVAVRRWVSFHGFALNVSSDLSFFDLIHPCGLQGIQMTSLERLLGASAPALAGVRTRAAQALARVLGQGRVRWVERETMVAEAASRAAILTNPLEGIPC